MAASTILSWKMIKPFSSTPPSLKRHSLSFMDYINLPLYIPMALFYPKPKNCNEIQISHILENSLSKVLASYYPFAGRIKDNNSYVHCNDMGAEYLNVRTNCPMSEILNHRDNDVVDVVFPHNLPWSSSVNRSPLVVQLSHFDCGGIAISVCLSHKIADGYSFYRFLNDWAYTARQVDFKPSRQFDASSLFPLMADPPAIPINVVVPDEPQRRVSRMYNFSSSSLGRLKDIVVATNSGVENPTRVEVATALLHKCGVAASMETSSGVFKPSLLSHVMNLRPQIPLNLIGNATCIFGSIAMTEDDIKLHNFVARMQKSKQQLRDELKDLDRNQLALHAQERIKEVVDIIERDLFDIYLCSSLSYIGLNKPDFGWGSPIRVTSMRYPMKKNFIFLNEPSGDGINVLISLPEADMSIFQIKKEFLEFASPVVH
ncbi:unnamed protein product [Withania somnifera]